MSIQFGFVHTAKGVQSGFGLISVCFIQEQPKSRRTHSDSDGFCYTVQNPTRVEFFWCDGSSVNTRNRIHVIGSDEVVNWRDDGKMPSSNLAFCLLEHSRKIWRAVAVLLLPHESRELILLIINCYVECMFVISMRDVNEKSRRWTVLTDISNGPHTKTNANNQNKKMWFSTTVRTRPYWRPVGTGHGPFHSILKQTFLLSLPHVQYKLATVVGNFL